MALHNLITILSVSVQSLCYNTPPLGQFFSNSYITSCLGVTYSCLVLGYKDFIGDFDISSVSATIGPMQFIFWHFFLIGVQVCVSKECRSSHPIIVDFNASSSLSVAAVIICSTHLGDSLGLWRLLPHQYQQGNPVGHLHTQDR